MRILGHRGAAALAPENSLAALAAGLAAGADGVEFDVGLTADGVPVLLHDPTLDRTTPLTGPLGDRPWREVSAFLPRLADALSLVRERGALAVVEVKPQGEDRRLAEAVVRVLRGAEGLDGLVVSSFAWSLLEEVRALAPEAALAVTLGRRSGGDPFAAAARLGAVELHPHRQLVTPALLARARETGLAVHPWTVNDLKEAQALAAVGVDGLFTDDPGIVRALR